MTTDSVRARLEAEIEAAKPTGDERIDKSSIKAVQWRGDNMAEVLAFTGHRDACVNSFGDPVILTGIQYRAVEIGQWIFRDRRGGLHHCHMDVLEVVQASAARISVLEERIRELEQQRHEVLSLTSEWDSLGLELVVSLDMICDIYGVTDTDRRRVCGSCDDSRWVDDENWQPAAHEHRRRVPGSGRIPCGICNHGGWNEPDGAALDGEDGERAR